MRACVHDAWVYNTFHYTLYPWIKNELFFFLLHHTTKQDSVRELNFHSTSTEEFKPLMTYLWQGRLTQWIPVDWDRPSSAVYNSSIF